MKKHKVLSSLISLVIALLIAASMTNCCSAAGSQKTYITNLCLLDTSYSDDWTVLISGLNLYDLSDSSEQFENVYLAYKTGAEENAVTDIRVLTYYTASGVSINGINYIPVSATSLNSNADGADIYMYYTKDIAAGEPIMGLSTSAYRTDKEVEGYDGAALLGNGYEPIKNEGGEPANLDSGREGMYLYLHEIHKTVYKPYICNVRIASADNRKNAIFKLASLGCRYFIDNDFTEGGSYVMIGYDRTADAANAITSLRGVNADAVNENTVTEGTVTFKITDNISLYSDREVYLAYATGTDSPIYTLDVAAFYEEQSFTVASCASCNFSDSSIMPYIRNESEYTAALDNTEVLKSVNVPFANDNENTINLSMIYRGTEAFVDSQIAADIKITEKTSEQEEVEHYTGELLSEEGEPIYFDDVETEATDNDGLETTASAFGASGIVTVIAVVLIGVGAVVVIISKKRKTVIKSNEAEEEK